MQLRALQKNCWTVIDSFEMAMSAEDIELKDLISGNKSTLQLLQTILEQFNVKTIDPHGEPFNAEYHEAMSMETSEKLEPGTVITVYQKGYLLNDRLLRPARVVVSKE